MNLQLSAAYSREEVIIALNQMHPSKAPGPDGFQAQFYQRYWHIVGEYTINSVLGFLNNSQPINDINHTNICLIPKSKHHSHVIDFRPISLCNVSYKLISKVLANRLKPILDSIISQNQPAFISDRLISDNIVIAHERINYISNKKKGKIGFGALKLDMSKAFDRVEWIFVKNIMLKLGFDVNFVSLIMNCLTSVSFSILINSHPKGNFLPSRGLCQGDPLSPYLFLLCSEGFSSLINNAEKCNLISGVSIAKYAPPISHLLFADDSILFFKANTNSCFIINNILKEYELASGQSINLNKSALFLSPNM